jgi:hypothetical protein
MKVLLCLVMLIAESDADLKNLYSWVVTEERGSIYGD